MAQHDQVIDNGPGLAVRTDFNNAFAALFSSNSGSVEPTTKVAGQVWYDTGTGKLWLRNTANTAWVEIAVNVTASYLPIGGGTLTGNLAIDPAAGTASLTLDKSAAGAGSNVVGSSATKSRWLMQLGDTTAEGGANTGSNFALTRYDDGGTLIDVPLTINRGNAGATFTGVLTIDPPASVSATMTLDKSASGLTNRIIGNTNGVARWTMELGDGTAEAGTSGSDFVLKGWNAGVAIAGSYLTMQRDTGYAAFGGTVAFGGNPNLNIQDNGTNRIFTMGNGYDFRFNPSTNTFTVVGASATWAQFLPGGNFTIIGATATKASGTTWANPSDERIKKDIKDYAPGLAEIAQLRPRTFRFKVKAGVDDGVHVGLIAQEAETVMPDLVSTGPGVVGGLELADMKTVDTSNVIFALVNAVKTLAKRVEVLEGQLAGGRN